ncbi:MAG: hypothetical protein HYY96_13030 [Candidatus Tectomicrobia bacterium]|nr:hypothetical protein [Candidatus Tectomicrobia bacterium]
MVKLSKSNAPAILTELEELAAKLCITVRYVTFQKGDVPVRSGSCRVRSEPFIIIDRKLSPVERAEVLVVELAKYPLESHYLPPRCRTLLESTRPLQPA